MLSDEGSNTSKKLVVGDKAKVHSRKTNRKLPTTQGGLSDSSCFESDTIPWETSDGMAKKELRGRALYDRLMDLKPGGMSEYDWAVRAGVNRGFFNDIKKRGTRPRSDTLSQVLAAAGKSMVDLEVGDFGAPSVAAANPPFTPHDLPRDVPIHGTAMGASLEVESNGDVTRIEETLLEDATVGYARRPPSISGNRKAYALYIVGESMEPRYRAGDLVYVDPKRAPSIGDDVIVQLVGEVNPDADPGEVQHVLIKQLVRSTATHYELAQFNPPLSFRVLKSRVHAVHRVIPLSELLS